MKKIITTVGTSIFSSLKDTIQNSVNTIKGKENKDWEAQKTRIDSIFNNVKDTILSDENCSAEIASVLKIANQYKHAENDFQVHLLATDSLQSRLACLLIQYWFEKYKNDDFTINSIFKDNYVIANLQVKRKQDFEKYGIINLINKLEEISEGYWGNCVFNITGGYKGLIPYMTIVGQVNQVSCFYNFQESKDDKFDLIEIPQAPLSLDWQFFDDNWKIFVFMAGGNLATRSRSENSNQDFDFPYSLFEGSGKACFEETDGTIDLTALGKTLWKKYQERYFVFYCPDEVWSEIQNQEDIKRILQTKLCKEEVRKGSKNFQKGDKWCYDDGNNNNRIYNLTTTDGKFVVYKTFQSESDALAYIAHEVDFEKIIANSQSQKILIQN